MAELKRRKIRVNGIVQGVGFRPFIFNLAQRHHLTGRVSNTSAGVIIEVQGNPKHLDTFQAAITTEAPPLATILEMSVDSIPVERDSAFEIAASDPHEKITTLISPDIAVCPDCLREMFDPDDRRYRYPFINCTNCGPRYTIIKELPYDRSLTSMQNFTMCPACQAEYDDPADRRFHAQPNACPDCGPRLALYIIDRQPVEADDLIQKAVELLRAGKVVAIKGLGGFHLAVDAANPKAVRELRRRKNREEKPLAVMVRDLTVARKLCELTGVEEQLLASPRSPIVLARKRANLPLSDAVAPGNDRLGLLLPYTPLHHLLLADDFTALIMTSANLSEEPICIANDEAFIRLQNIADYLLVHNRDIYLRSDDSVFINLAGKPRPVRRSRGYTPAPVLVNSSGPPILAVGGELKNTICLLQGNRAFLSQHIGDLENLEAYNFFRMTIEHFQRIFDTRPKLVVHDLHPRYLSTQWADKQDLPTLAVQHHQAHLAAVLAEHHLDEPVIGIILDGTGYGTDGTIWGGEILVGGYHNFSRYAALELMPIPGGDAAIEAPWRIAVSYLLQAFDGELPDLPFLFQHDFEPVADLVRKNVSCVATSSCGRLFDAVAALSGGRQTIRYEGQAAIEMMQAAGSISERLFDYEIEDGPVYKIMAVKPLIRSAAEAVLAGADLGEAGRRFHGTLVEMLVSVAEQARKDTDISKVVLSGGVFQNQILFENLLVRLEKTGLTVFTHEQVSTNDGGISLGQALIGRNMLARNG